ADRFHELPRTAADHRTEPAGGRFDRDPGGTGHRPDRQRLDARGRRRQGSGRGEVDEALRRVRRSRPAAHRHRPQDDRTVRRHRRRELDAAEETEPSPEASEDKATRTLVTDFVTALTADAASVVVAGDAGSAQNGLVNVLRTEKSRA